MRSTKIKKNFCSFSLWTCLHHMVILSQNKITDFFFMMLTWVSPFNHSYYPIGGEGCHLRVVPPGQLLRRPSTPKPFIEPGFSMFLTWSFFVFAFRWLRVFHWGCYVYFQFNFFIYSLYIHIYIFYIFFHCTHCRSTHNSSTICFFCVCSGFSLASWCWTGCPKETIAI